MIYTTTNNIISKALYLYFNNSRYCLDYVINSPRRVELLGTRVRIIVDITHLLVVERSYQI